METWQRNQAHENDSISQTPTSQQVIHDLECRLMSAREAQSVADRLINKLKAENSKLRARIKELENPQ